VTTPKLPPPPRKRPEEVGLVVPVGAHPAAVGGHELDRVDAVRREPVRAAEPAEPAAERVADDADVGRGARQRRQAVAGGRIDELERADARVHPGDPRPGVDLDPAHALGLDEDDVVERPERGGVVAGPCAATPRPKAWASSTTATTLPADSGKTTAAGRWSTARFQASRAWFQPSCSGRTILPPSALTARSNLPVDAVVVMSVSFSR
jgi:hypothetical protein